MVFPITPRDTVVELFVNSQWLDITSDVYARDGVTISRGRQNGQSTAEPQRATLTLNNRSGNYSPRNPTGSYYGSIGRNTPIRIGVRLARDSFTRTVANSWGVADTGHTYTLTGVGGTVQNSDWSVSGGVGTMSVPVTTATRTVTIDSVVLRDVDVSASAKVVFNKPTGAAVYPIFIRLRQYSSTDYVFAWARIETAGTGTVTVGVSHFDGTVIVAPTVASFTHTAVNGMTVRAQAEGQTYRIKAWSGNAPEPYDWAATGNSSRSMAAGGVGLSAWVPAGVTTTLPIVVSYDNVAVTAPRFFGEAASWPQRWDTSGIDVYVPVEASGITRRVSQGVSPLPSALFQAVTTLPSPPVVYWPCEDRQFSGSIASGIGGNPMAISGTTDFASFTGLPSSAPLPVLKAGTWTGSVPQYATTGDVQLRFVCTVPGTPPVFTPIVEVYTTGSVGYWAISLGYVAPNPPAMYLEVYDKKNGTLQLNLATTSLASALQTVSLRINQAGSNVNYSFDCLPFGSYVGGAFLFLLTTGTVGVVNKIVVDPQAVLQGATIGHISLHTTVSSITDIESQTNGYTGEYALDRMQRLAALAGIPVDYQGASAATEPVGFQRVATALTGIRECETADAGILHEPKGSLGLSYRSRATMYNQSPILSLDYTAGQLAPPLEPVDDDQQTRNDITVNRQDGASGRAQLLTGTLSVQDPSAGGVGRYDDAPTVNLADDSQAPELAGWLLNVGTVDEPRYPTVTVNLANPNFVAAALEQSALDVAPGDAITIGNPKTGQTPDDITLIVQGYTEIINVFEHTIKFVCSPESAYEVAALDSIPPFLFAGDSAALAVGVTSTATSLSVNVGAIPWVTGAVSIPIIIAGETMTVTNITGVSTPQTFTVTRSTNGVTKPQTTGAAVVLQRFYLPVLAL